MRVHVDGKALSVLEFFVIESAANFRATQRKADLQSQII